MSLQEYAVGGEQIADTHSPAAAPVPTFEVLHTASITPSLTNPRKTFDAGKLKELAESIRASGVHQPILVRPLPGSRTEDTFLDRGWGQPLPTYELIAGERRLRACRLAGVDEIPAMIKHLTDAQVLECQIVENLQRDDLAPLEEAEGYQALIDATGLNKDQVGERIGRSRTYVYGRLKLLDLCHEARNALREGKIDASKGLLIARIPNEALQIKAVKHLSQTDYRGEPIGQREAMSWIRANVMLKLSDARFNIKSVDLVQVAGSCESCEKRTGANPDLFSDIDAPDLCTDPDCFRAKGDAHVAAITERARAKGMEVIEGKEAQELKPNRWGGIQGFMPLDQVVAEDDDGKRQTLRSLLSKADMKAVALFVDPHGGEPLELISSALADKVLAKADLGKDVDQEEDDWSTKQREKAAKRDLLQQYEAAWRGQVGPRLQRHIDEGHVQAFDGPMLRVILAMLADNELVDGEVVERVLQIPDGDLHGASIRAAVKAIPDEQLGARVVSLLLAQECHDLIDWMHESGMHVATDTPVIESLAASAGVDLASVKADVQEEMKAAAAERAKDEAVAAPAAGKAKRPGGNRKAAKP